MERQVPAPARAGFIGAGRVARALAHAVRRAGIDVAAAWSPTFASRQRIAAEFGISAASSPDQAIDGCDVVVVAVPDEQLDTVVADVLARVPAGGSPLVVVTSGSASIEALAAAAATERRVDPTAGGPARLVRRGRGAIVALLASALAILGISTLPGMLIADFYASAGGQLVGPEKMREIEVLSQGGWGGGAIVGPGMVGFLLSLPIAAFAAVRAGYVRWWAPLVVVAGLASFTIGGATSGGNAVMTAWFALLGLAILRVPLAAFGGREAATVAHERETLVVEGEPAAERPVAIA